MSLTAKDLLPLVAELPPSERTRLARLLRDGEVPAAPRPFGLCAGVFEVPDDFDAPLPNEVLDAFEGS
jgi:hypothetical protein